MKKRFMMLLAAALPLSVMACDVDVKDKGEVPDVDVETKGGRMPDVDVTGPDVDVGTKKETVTVPDVDVDTKKKTITVPDVDVDVPQEHEQ